MRAVTAAARRESLDVSQREDVPKLRKNAVGLLGVLFLTVTGSAPISAMLFNTPIVVGYGNGVGAPAAFLFATIVLVVFSVGYVAMARKKTTAGGFYSYISHGLGREIGIGTGYGSVLAYSVFEASLCGGFAYFLNLKLALFGINIGWPWLALAMVVIISLLAYFDIRLSSIVLGIGLISEIVVLLIFDGSMFAHGHIPWAAINPVNAFKALPASPGAGRRRGRRRPVLRVLVLGRLRDGAELRRGVQGPQAQRAAGAVHLGDRARHLLHPDQLGTVRRVLQRGRGGQEAQTKPRPQYYIGPANAIAGHWVGSLLSFLIITGSFACGMAFHNTTARYAYSLGREGLLPRQLGKTHPRWQQPAHRVDHPVGRRRADRDRVRAVHRLERPGQPGLPAAVRADGGDGRDRHPGCAGAGLDQHRALFPAPPRG